MEFSSCTPRQDISRASVHLAVGHEALLIYVKRDLFCTKRHKVYLIFFFLKR